MISGGIKSAVAVKVVPSVPPEVPRPLPPGRLLQFPVAAEEIATSAKAATWLQRLQTVKNFAMPCVFRLAGAVGLASSLLAWKLESDQELDNEKRSQEALNHVGLEENPLTFQKNIVGLNGKIIPLPPEGNDPAEWFIFYHMRHFGQLPGAKTDRIRILPLWANVQNSGTIGFKAAEGKYEGEVKPLEKGDPVLKYVQRELEALDLRIQRDGGIGIWRWSRKEMEQYGADLIEILVQVQTKRGLDGLPFWEGFLEDWMWGYLAMEPYAPVRQVVSVPLQRAFEIRLSPEDRLATIRRALLNPLLRKGRHDTPAHFKRLQEFVSPLLDKPEKEKAFLIEVGVACLFHPDFDYSKDAVGALEKLLETHGIFFIRVWCKAMKEAWGAVDAVRILKLEQLFDALEWDQVEPYALSYDSVRLNVFHKILEKIRTPDNKPLKMEGVLAALKLIKMLATTRSLRKYEGEFQERFRKDSVVTADNLGVYASFLIGLHRIVLDGKMSGNTFEVYNRMINEKFLGWLDQQMPSMVTDGEKTKSLEEEVRQADQELKKAHLHEMAVYTESARKKFEEQLSFAIQKILDDPDLERASKVWIGIRHSTLLSDARKAFEALQKEVYDRIHQVMSLPDCDEQIAILDERLQEFVESYLRKEMMAKGIFYKAMAKLAFDGQSTAERKPLLERWSNSPNLKGILANSAVQFFPWLTEGGHLRNVDQYLADPQYLTDTYEFAKSLGVEDSFLRVMKTDFIEGLRGVWKDRGFILGVLRLTIQEPKLAEAIAWVAKQFGPP